MSISLLFLTLSVVTPDIAALASGLKPDDVTIHGGNASLTTWRIDQSQSSILRWYSKCHFFSTFFSRFLYFCYELFMLSFHSQKLMAINYFLFLKIYQTTQYQRNDLTIMFCSFLNFWKLLTTFFTSTASVLIGSCTHSIVGCHNNLPCTKG